MLSLFNNLYNYIYNLYNKNYYYNTNNFIKQNKINYNLDYNKLRKEVLKYNEGIIVQNDTLLVNTGKFTGRCPNDRYIVYDDNTKDNIDWGIVNKPIQKSTFDKIFNLHYKYLESNKKVYVFDGFIGTSKKSRRSIRVITELVWHHHFCKNMFINPTEEELNNFIPDIIIINSNAKFEEWFNEGLNSETCIALDVYRKLIVITGTQYSGEIKKAAFSLMNYLLPNDNIMSMHCSATIGIKYDVCLFFGLSGTGKTTLSADSSRYLIGDDEHGWDDDGIFNLEGGCYAKMINIDPIKEPLIYNAICRNSILENVICNNNGICDYSNNKLTENTRGSYPISHIPNNWNDSITGHPNNIIFLTADAFGILPPVSKLTKEQALYHLISGYTSKIAGTEMGIIDPIATFSICFGGAFMPLSAEVYAKLFKKKINEHNSNIYLVNTGWTGGIYGIGKRMNILTTRKIINAILKGYIHDNNLHEPDLNFQLRIPKNLIDIDNTILNPSLAWEDKNEFNKYSIKLKDMYVKNWEKYKDNNFMKNIGNYGPGGNALLYD